MTTTCGDALKNARIRQKMDVKTAALKMNVSERRLYKYEEDAVKEKDPTVFLEAMKIYNDIRIGTAYLESDPVFAYLFGDIKLTDALRAATKYAAEANDDNNRINIADLLGWGLSDGAEPLQEKITKKIRATIHSVIDLYLNIRQKNGLDR